MVIVKWAIRRQTWRGPPPISDLFAPNDSRLVWSGTLVTTTLSTCRAGHPVRKLWIEPSCHEGLTKRGHRVHRQVGVAKYRLDLAVLATLHQESLAHARSRQPNEIKRRPAEESDVVYRRGLLTPRCPARRPCGPTFSRRAEKVARPTDLYAVYRD